MTLNASTYTETLIQSELHQPNPGVIIHNIILLLRADIRSLLEAESASPIVLLGLFNVFSFSNSLPDSVVDDTFLNPRVDCLRRVVELSVFFGPSMSEASLSLCAAVSLGTDESLLETREVGFSSLVGFGFVSSELGEEPLNS